MCQGGLCLLIYLLILCSPTFIYPMLTQTALIVHCLTHKGRGGGTGPASYLWAGVQWGRQRTYCADTASPRRSVVGSFLHSKSPGAVMRLFLAFVIFLCDVGFIGCKLSPKCPSGQFMWKNQCVLCHPACSECNGHELFECTTCGVGEPFLPVLSA